MRFAQADHIRYLTPEVDDAQDDLSGSRTPPNPSGTG